MASPKSPNGAGRLPVYGTKEDINGKDETAVLDFERPRFSHAKTPDLSAESQNGRLTPNPPAVLGPFDWDDFEARYEKALMDADEQEREILKEAESLAKVRNTASCLVIYRHVILKQANSLCSISGYGLRLPQLMTTSER